MASKGLVRQRTTKQWHNLTARGVTKRSKARAQGGGESKIKGFAEAGRDWHRHRSAAVRSSKARHSREEQSSGFDLNGEVKTGNGLERQDSDRTGKGKAKPRGAMSCNGGDGYRKPMERQS